MTQGFKTDNAKPAQPKTFDQRGTNALQKKESRQAYEKAHPMARPYEYNRDQQARGLRKEVAGDKWKSRPARHDQKYRRYQNQPPVFVQTYNDPFGNMFFWMWLMEQNNHSRDQFLYHRQNDIDPARLAAFKEKDADLDRRLKALEQSGVKRDLTYAPEEFKNDKDLMYGDDVVTQVAKEEHSSSKIWLWLGVLLILGAGVYLVFIKRWKPRRAR